MARDEALYNYVGETLADITPANVSVAIQEFKKMGDFKSEITIENLIDQFNTASDLAREGGSKFMDQLRHLSVIIEMLGDPLLNDAFAFDAMKLADLTSQLLMSLKLLRNDASLENTVLVFTCCVTKFNLPRDKMVRCIKFVSDALKRCIAAISTLGYSSEASLDNFIGTVTSLCDKAHAVMDDKVIDITLTFLTKCVAFWTTISGGFSEDQLDLQSIPKLVEYMRGVAADGGDIIECMLATYRWLVDNFPKFYKGDFEGLLFGKNEYNAFEAQVSQVKKIYPLIAAGRWNIIKEEYGYTEVSYNARVADLIKTCRSMMKKAKHAQMPALKRCLDELNEVQVNQFQKNAQIQHKAEAIGVCFVGASGVGKSTLMEETSRILISASGEIPTSDMIVTGQMSDKFDSNELPHHLSIQYDDVGNNSNNENFDKLLNAVNSQSRPFLKAGVEEKGVMFPGNVACVISTNVPGINAHKSNCPDSIGRRFLHIETSIKEHLLEEVCIPGTRRVDNKRAVNKDGSFRMDIWNFKVYEFITFEDPGPDGLPPGTMFWEGMIVRELQWTQKPREDATYWDLALFLTKRAKVHYQSQKKALEAMRAHKSIQYCEECHIPVTVCPCQMKSEFISSISIDMGIERAATCYNDIVACLGDVYSAAKWRAMWFAVTTLVPININNMKRYILPSWLVICVISRDVLMALMLSIIFAVGCYLYEVYRTFKGIEHTLARQYGVLSQLADDTMNAVRTHRKNIFVGLSMVTFLYAVYRAFRPRSEQMSYAASLPENIRSAMVRAERARTTAVDEILPHVKKDIGKIEVIQGSKVSSCLAFPIEANFYVTAGHLIPDKGDVEIVIRHNDTVTPTASKQKLSQEHIYRFPGKDLVLIQVPSAIPRKGYKDFLLGRSQLLGNQVVKLVTMDLDTYQRLECNTRISPGWSMFNNYLHTGQASVYKPYQYISPIGTKNGMCGSVIMDYAKAIIYGFHVAGNTKVGMMSALTMEDINEAMSKFKGFIPLNRGDLQLGSQQLEKGPGLCEVKVGDPEHDKELEEHNCATEGIISKEMATFKSPYRKHPFYESVEAQFGPHKFGPPQGINDMFHKRKALTKLTDPNQEFSLRELDLVKADYVKPIIEVVQRMKPEIKAELARVLTLEEALDGLCETGLGGIDNSTSVGYPFRGKKKDFLIRDPLDPTIPLTPRELVPKNGVDMKVEMEEMLARYRAGMSCRPLFKCSMKTNELLPIEKKKARVFMGSNFPFLLLCRQYLGSIMRLISRNKILFETAKGINMDSIECEELFNHLNVEEGKRIVALDYSAYDQTMSGQVTTCVAGIVVDLMKELGCSEDHILIVRGLLTDIVYPNLLFFNTVIQLANSDPSGNPITTELNGMVNSLYLRCFFYRIYPNLLGKISYRDCIKTMTYGDDNINGVPKKYEEFNGVNIVAVGKKLGLKITMADKDAEITKFTDIWNSDFLKRKFRYCDDLGHIRAPLVKSSITKAFYWMKKDSPDPPEILFSQNVDGALRKASQHGRDYFNEIRAKLLAIATAEEISHTICKWWTYDELIKHDKDAYYDHHRSGLNLHGMVMPMYVDHEGFVSESFERDNFVSEYFEKEERPKQTSLIGKVVYELFDTLVSMRPFIITGRSAELGLSQGSFMASLIAMLAVRRLIDERVLDNSLKASFNIVAREARRLVVDTYLKMSEDMIRPQAYCIYLEGTPGCGKTIATLLIIKKLLPNCNESACIVLNEEDDFQSELRSFHKVVILDDIGNTKPGLEAKNIIRRPLDYVNNTPRRALSPEAELKGNVKIQPELVLLTSNVSAEHIAHCNSQIPSSLYRRWLRVRLVKTAPFEGSLDLTKWRFEIFYPKYRGNKAGESVYDDQQYDKVPDLKFDTTQFLRFVLEDYERHSVSQKKLIAEVKQHFKNEERPSLFKRVNAWFATTSFKSESESWDLDLIDRIVAREGEWTRENFVSIVREEAIKQQKSGVDYDYKPELVDYTAPTPWYILWGRWLGIIPQGKFYSEALVTVDDMTDQQKEWVKCRMFYNDGAVITRDFACVVQPRYFYPFTHMGMKSAPQYTCEYREGHIDFRHHESYYPSTTLERWRDEIIRREQEVEDMPDDSTISSVAGTIKSVKIDCIPETAPLSIINENSWKDAYIASSFERELIERNIPYLRAVCPSRTEALAQNGVLFALPNWNLVARELKIGATSCDMILQKDGVLMFVEAKSSKPKKCKIQAQERKAQLQDVFPEAEFAYYTSSERKVIIV